MNVRIKRMLFIASDVLSVVPFLLRRCRPKPGLTILSYHRLARGLPREAQGNPHNVDPERFAEQLEIVRTMMESPGRRRGRVVSIEEVARWVRHGPPSSGAYLLLTFDDGWQHVLPAAEQMAVLGVPAVFFVPTAYVGSEFFDFSVFDTWCSSTPGAHSSWYRPLTRADLERLLSIGMDVQPHGHAHRALGNLSPDEMRADVAASLAYFRETLGVPVVAFAYPFGGTFLGDVTPAVEAEVRAAGITFALSSDAGSNRFDRLQKESLHLRRIPVNDYDRGLLFRAKAAGYSGLLPVLKPLYQLFLRFWRGRD